MDYSNIASLTDEHLIIIFRESRKVSSISRNHPIYLEFLRRIESYRNVLANQAKKFDSFKKTSPNNPGKISRDIDSHANLILSQESILKALQALQVEIGIKSDFKKKPNEIVCPYNSNWEYQFKVNSDGIVIEVYYFYIPHKSSVTGDNTNSHFHAWIYKDGGTGWHAKKRADQLMQFHSSNPRSIYFPEMNQYQSFDRASEGVKKTHPLRIFYGVLPVWVNKYVSKLGKKATF